MAGNRGVYGIRATAIFHWYLRAPSRGGNGTNISSYLDKATWSFWKLGTRQFVFLFVPGQSRVVVFIEDDTSFHLPLLLTQTDRFPAGQHSVFFLLTGTVIMPAMIDTTVRPTWTKLRHVANGS